MHAELSVYRLEYPKRCWRKHTINFSMVWTHTDVDGTFDVGGIQPPYFTGSLVLTCSNSQHAPCWCLTKRKTKPSRFSPSQKSQIWRQPISRTAKIISASILLCLKTCWCYCSLLLTISSGLPRNFGCEISGIAFFRCKPVSEHLYFAVKLHMGKSSGVEILCTQSGKLCCMIILYA